MIFKTPSKFAVKCGVFPKRIQGKGDEPRMMSSSSRNIQDIISQSQKVRSDQLASLSVNLAMKSTKHESQIYICFRQTTQTQTLLDCWKFSAKPSSSLSILHGLSIGKQHKKRRLPQKSLEKQKMLSTKQRRLLHLVLMDISAGIFGHKNVDLDESESDSVSGWKG